MKNLVNLSSAVVFSLALMMIFCSNRVNNGNDIELCKLVNADDGDKNVNGDPNHGYPPTAIVFPKAVTDIDGNTYDAVQIGSQVWMAENLRTTRYANGKSISLGSEKENENDYSRMNPYRYTPKGKERDMDNMDIVSSYGYLYNWPAVMNGAAGSETNPSGVQGICPNGWHVPSNAEWKRLIDYMNTQPIYLVNDHDKHLAKSLATTWGWKLIDTTRGWLSIEQKEAPGKNISANNASGFSALPVGYFKDGFFDYFSYRAFFWSATEDIKNPITMDRAYVYLIYHDEAKVQETREYQNTGLSVRCIRD